MKKIVLSSLLALLCSAALWAVPAHKSVIKSKQADGTEISLQLVGDEYMHYYVNTANGQKMTQGKDGFFHPIETQLLEEMKGKAAVRRAADNQRRLSTMANNNGPHHELGQPENMTGQKKGIVILVNFADKKMKENHTQETFDRMFNENGYSEDGHIGSVRDYFLKQSYDQLTIDFDVVGPYDLSQNMSYYGGNNYWGSDKNPGAMVKEACAKAANEVDFSEYDWTGNGYVDQVFVIYAGYGENYGGDSNTIWPHEWDLESAGIGDLNYNDKKIHTYACCAELTGTSGSTLNGMGTACHEFSHCLGYPDLYDTDYSGGVGMDSYDVMCKGSYNGPNDRGEVPSAYTAYERWMAGWMKPDTLTEPMNIKDMPALNDEGKAYVIVNEKNKNEFFVLENRQARDWFGYYGNWTAGHGLFIYHIDYDASAWHNNSPNDNPNHQRVTWVPADKSRTNGTYAKMVNDFFSDTAGSNSFVPSDYASAGGKWFSSDANGTNYTDHVLTEIEENANGLISFLVDGGDTGERFSVTFDPGSGDCEMGSWTQSTSSSQSIVLPTATIDDDNWIFMGWSESNIPVGTEIKPTLFEAGSKYVPTTDITLFAVYTHDDHLYEIGSYTLDYSAETALQEIELAYDSAVVYTAADSSTWVIKALKTEEGMKLSKGKSSSIKVPECPSPINTIEIDCKTARTFRFSATDYTGSNNPAVIQVSNSSTHATLNFSESDVTTGYIFTNSGQTVVTKVVVNYGMPHYSDWATDPYIGDLTTPTITFEKGEDIDMQVGDTYTDVATVTNSTGAISYSSSNTAAATVDENGVVTACGIGNAIITAKVEAVKGVSRQARESYYISVSMPDFIGAEIKSLPEKTDYIEFETFKPAGLVLEASYANGYKRDITSGYTYTPSGKLTPADTFVFITYTESDVTFRDSIAITVEALPRYTITLEVGTGQCDVKQLSQVNYKEELVLPTATIMDSLWVFAGWGAAQTDSLEGLKQELYLGGSKISPTEDMTLYAVYAKSDGAPEHWIKKAVNDTLADGTYALITEDGHAFSGTIVSGNGRVTAKAFKFDENGDCFETPLGVCELNVTNVEGGFTLYNKQKGYLMAKAKSSGKLSWYDEEGSYWYGNEEGSLIYEANGAVLRGYNNSSFRTYAIKSASPIGLAYKVSGPTVIYDSEPYISGGSGLEEIGVTTPADAIYTISGRQIGTTLDRLTPGLYIIGGKKVMIK